MLCFRTVCCQVIGRSNKICKKMEISCDVLLIAAIQRVLAKHCSSKPLDMKQIARANKQNSSLDGVKKSVKQKVKKTKAKETELQSTENESGKHLPDWLNVVLETPLTADQPVNTAKHQMFKDFVEELNLTYLPSVSTVLQKTQSKKAQEVLKNWMEAKTEELGGVQQFKDYKSDMLKRGTNLHKCIELYLKGETDFPVAEGSQGHWKSVRRVLGEVRDVKFLELDCVHPEMFYRGKVDCVAVLRDTLCLIEWKTSSKLKPLLSATYDNPIQVAAYVGAVNRSGVLKQYNIPNVTSGALVIAYSTREPATVHMMSPKVCERYWHQWLSRLYMYWALQYEGRTETE